MPRSSDRNHPPHEDNSQNTNSSQASASTSSITLEQIEERRNSKIERAKRDAQNVRRVHAGSLYELFLMYSRQEKLTDQLEGGPAHFPPGAPPSEAPEEGEGGKDWEDFKEEFGLDSSTSIATIRFPSTDTMRERLAEELGAVLYKPKDEDGWEWDGADPTLASLVNSSTPGIGLRGVGARGKQPPASPVVKKESSGKTQSTASGSKGAAGASPATATGSTSRGGRRRRTGTKIDRKDEGRDSPDSSSLSPSPAPSSDEEEDDQNSKDQMYVDGDESKESGGRKASGSGSRSRARAATLQKGGQEEEKKSNKRGNSGSPVKAEPTPIRMSTRGKSASQSQSTDGVSQSQSQLQSQATNLTVPSVRIEDTENSSQAAEEEIANLRPPPHPTLQQLAPNPLSVIYASGLRPLPPDPHRRFTGTGVSGGAIHHRGVRKQPPILNNQANPLLSNPALQPGASINPAQLSNTPASSLNPSQASPSTSLLTVSGSTGVPPGPANSGPVDLWRWYVRTRASPGAGLVARADKCLSTNDWSVAFQEQRFIKAMARIEKLKSKNEWSFRQIKKQKGPVVRKSAWDHLLEEMKWMQTDFREERRWKIAVAYQLAHAVEAWHRAPSAAARRALCIKVRKSSTMSDSEQAVNADGDLEMKDADAEELQEKEVQPAQRSSRRGKEKEVETDEASKIQETDKDMTMDIDAEPDAEGEDEDADADADADADGDADDGEVEEVTRSLLAQESEAKPPPVEVVREPLKQANERMPTLSISGDAKAADGLDAETDATNKRSVRIDAPNKDSTLASSIELPVSLIHSVRAPVFSMDIGATVVSPSSLIASVDPDSVSQMLGIDSQEVSALLESEEMTASKLFPELPLYDSPSLPDPTGKSDRRWDEGSLNLPPRLTHVSRLLDAKPILVSTLAPSKNRARGRWIEDSDWMIASEIADPNKGLSPSELENLALMGGVAPPGSVLFSRKAGRGSKEVPPVNHTPAAPPSADIRAAQFLWTPEEDQYLLALAKQYNSHWQLVSDLFNSTRMSVPTDRRDPWDCFDRASRISQAIAKGVPPPPPPTLSAAVAAQIDAKMGAGTSAAAAQHQQQSNAANGGPPPASDSDLTIPALPQNSLAAKRERITKKINQKHDGSRKKLRRVNLIEVMKKNSKRREATLANKAAQASMTNQNSQSGGGPRKVNLTSHETHAQIKNGPTPTPGQLSAAKADQEEARMRQIQAMHIHRIQQQKADAQARQQAQQAQQGGGGGGSSNSSNQGSNQGQQGRPQSQSNGSSSGNGNSNGQTGNAPSPSLMAAVSAIQNQNQQQRPQAPMNQAALAAVQAQLANNPAANNLTPEQLQQVAMQLYRQSQQAQQSNQSNQSNQARQ